MTQTEMELELEFTKRLLSALLTDSRSLLTTTQGYLRLLEHDLKSVELPEDSEIKKMLQQAIESLEKYDSLHEQVLHDWKEFHGQGD